MPKPPISTASTMIAMRRCRQNVTNWSIIEQNSALHDDLIAGIHAGTDGDGSALLQRRLDGTAFEGPRRGCDEHAGSVVVHQERGTRHHHLRMRRTRDD